MALTTIRDSGLASGVREWTALTAVTTNGASSYTVSGIPSGVTEVLIIGCGVHRNTGTNRATIQLGDSGGLETTGYTHTVSYTQGGNYYINTNQSIAGAQTMFYNAEYNFRCHCFNTTGNEWNMDVKTMSEGGSSYEMVQSMVRKSLSAELDRVALVDLNGTNFDGGTLRVYYR